MVSHRKTYFFPPAALLEPALPVFPALPWALAVLSAADWARAAKAASLPVLAYKTISANDQEVRNETLHIHLPIECERHQPGSSFRT